MAASVASYETAVKLVDAGLPARGVHGYCRVNCNIDLSACPPGDKCKGYQGDYTVTDLRNALEGMEAKKSKYICAWTGFGDAWDEFVWWYVYNKDKVKPATIIDDFTDAEGLAEAAIEYLKWRAK